MINFLIGFGVGYVIGIAIITVWTCIDDNDDDEWY